jgi:predicted ATP-dependent endonuclease of OLD family
MLLKTLFLRFYKSFNYDYLKRYSDKDKVQYPWEFIDNNPEKWYPYVEIQIDKKVTTIVGANESGKTHILDAIKKGISGEEISYEDFCRYSHFFTVTQEKLRFPDFGYEWTNLKPKEKEIIKKICNISDEINLDTFLMFRTNKTTLTIYLEKNKNARQYSQYSLDDGECKELTKILPNIIPIEAKIALPDSVPIVEIQERAGLTFNNRVTTKLEPWQRQKVDQLLDAIAKNGNIHITKDTDAGIRIKNDTPTPMFPAKDFLKIPIELENEVKQIQTLINYLEYRLQGEDRDKRSKQFNLAYQLICEVAKVDPEALSELADNCFKVGKEGYVEAIVSRINRNLAENLNFPSWWVQDREFRLIVSANNYDLRFSISDRTGSKYSFSERSAGLKYFLSYYIQYKAHKPHSSKSEILLMDEPDAYLSSQAQQDLIKIFESFANGQEDRESVQVIYVTHSPFLINKNYPHRIRVLEKGVEDEGTRVITETAKNHYEPLRSAFGTLLGETAFIGNCNLIVESLADQILIAGIATYLNFCNDITPLGKLDLNRITIIPSGEVAFIPYLLYLSLGKDSEKPAMMVLLNSGIKSNNIKDSLPKNQVSIPLLKAEFILQISDFNTQIAETNNLVSLEDIIPLSIMIEAIKRYMKVFYCQEEISNKIVAEVTTKSSKYIHVDDIYKIYNKNEIHIDRVGFVRSIIDTINENPNINGISELKENFVLLFQKINSVKEKAISDLTQERIYEKIRQMKKSFILDHPDSALGADALRLFSNMENILDDSKEGIATKKEIQELRASEKYNITVNQHEKIKDYDEFKAELERIIKVYKHPKNNNGDTENPTPNASLEENPNTQNPVNKKTNTAKSQRQKINPPSPNGFGNKSQD